MVAVWRRNSHYIHINAKYMHYNRGKLHSGSLFAFMIPECNKLIFLRVYFFSNIWPWLLGLFAVHPDILICSCRMVSAIEAGLEDTDDGIIAI